MQNRAKQNQIRPNKNKIKPNKASSGSHSGQETIFRDFKLDFDSYERYLDFETGVLHRISCRIYLAEWFGLGSHFGKNTTLGYFPKNEMTFFWKNNSKMVSTPMFPEVEKVTIIKMIWPGMG